MDSARRALLLPPNAGAPRSSPNPAGVSLAPWRANRRSGPLANRGSAPLPRHGRKAIIESPGPHRLALWVGSSKQDLRRFPADVRYTLGRALLAAQRGSKVPAAKPLGDSVGPMSSRSPRTPPVRLIDLCIR